jgi:hypothetical protein
LASRHSVLCAFACVALLAPVGAAAAEPHDGLTIPREACPIENIRSNVVYWCTAEFSLRGSNGYRITVSAELDSIPASAGPESVTSPVELSVKGHSGTAQYSVSGQVTANTIKARFGRLGRVSVRFRPSGHQRRVRVPKKCIENRLPVVTATLGSFVGTIEFRGERGYTNVSARRAKGGIGDPLADTAKKLVCDFHESDAERKRELESVSLDASPPDARIGFDAGRLFGTWPGLPSPVAGPGGIRNLFFALASEEQGGMSIIRAAASLGGSEDFVFDDALTSATVSPPFPFSGSGSFLRNPDGSTSWTGTLAVLLPGLGTVGLTGGSAELATVATHLQQLEERVEGR